MYSKGIEILRCLYKLDKSHWRKIVNFVNTFVGIVFMQFGELSLSNFASGVVVVLCFVCWFDLFCTAAIKNKILKFDNSSY